jgi:hypothetical protein
MDVRDLDATDGPSRQTCWVLKSSTRTLPSANGGWKTVSVRPEDICGAHGLTGSLVPLGGDLIELVAPCRDGTTAGRLLQKRGEGGYMIIMQTEDAKRRKDHIEEKGLAKVIFGHEDGDVVCVQYHPKGIKG